MFTDKYVPTTFDDLDTCELSIADHALRSYARCGLTNVPHMIFLGPNGCGKKTRVMLYLNERYGLDPHHIKTVYLKVKHPTKTLMVRILQSSFHQQICPGSFDVYDRLVLKEFLLRTVYYKSLTTGVKVIVVEDADHLTKNAQQSLRRVLEKYVGNCRFIFLATNEHRLTDALKSRCLTLRFPAASEEHIGAVLRRACGEEHINYLDKHIDSIVAHTGRNMKRALMLLDTMSIGSSLNAPRSEPRKHDTVNEGIYDVVRVMFSCNNVTTAVDDIRKKLFLLVSHKVPLDYVVYKTCMIVIEQIGHIEKKAGRDFCDMRSKLVKCTIDHRRSVMSAGQPIFHMESFFIRVFIMIKTLQST